MYKINKPLGNIVQKREYSQYFIGNIVQKREYSQYFIITLNGV